MSVQKQLDEFMEGVKKQAPAEVLAVVDKANLELAKSGKFDRALKVGDTMPAFSLPGLSGSNIESRVLLEKGPLVISFNRGAWCPFCNIEWHALQKALPEIRQLGAELIAISPEKPEYSADFKEKNNLSFDMLFDFGNHVAKQFGIVFKQEGELREVALQAFGVDLPKFNGDDSWDLPVPATFVVDKKGTIRFAFVDPEFRHRAEPEEIIRVLKSL